MKKQSSRYYLLAALSLPLFFPTVYARVVVQHLGGNDPLTEGFELLTFSGSSEVGSVFDDLGRDAWMIKTNGVQDIIRYLYVLSDRELDDAMTYGWELSATARFIDLGVQALSFHVGTEIFTLRFSTDPDGVIRVSDNRGTSYTIADSDGGYHSYKLRYDPLTELAELWVDGADTGVELLPAGASSSQGRFRLAAGEGISHGNWQEFSLTIIPEPATVALLTGAGALFVAGFVRRRKRRRPIQIHERVN